MQFFMNFMREHRRLLLAFILLFIAVPFVFAFGMPSCNTGQLAANQDEVLASVGGVPIYESAFRRALNDAAQRMAPRGERPSFQELAADGTADRLLQQMVDSALISNLVQDHGLEVTDEFVQERMKESPQFQNDDGEFVPALWNAWVENNMGIDWNAEYAFQREQIARQVFLTSVLAPGGRVLEKEIEEQLVNNHTKHKIEFAKIEPPVSLSEEEIRAHYDENTDQYKAPDSRVAEYVAVPLLPDPPEIAETIVKDAREGYDFAELAKVNSDTMAESGGDLGWQSERERETEYRKVLFTLEPGEVSDPISSPGGYFIFKVEEERVNEETGQREVKARQIFLRTQLSEEERAERMARAEEISEAAKEAGNLEDVAAEYGLEIVRTGQFNAETRDVENLPNGDVFAFRNYFETRDEDAAFDVIEAPQNLYIAKMAALHAGFPKPFEEVRSQVEQDAIAAHKRTEEYRERVSEVAAKIEETRGSIDCIKENFPELNMEVKESKEFTGTDLLYQDGLYLQTQQVIAAFKDKEPGALAGPMTDWRQDTYFLELVSRTPPAEEDKENWDEERKQLRENAMRLAQNDLIQDYALHLRESMLPNMQVSVNQEVMAQVIGPADDGGQEDAEPEAAEGEAAAAGESADSEETSDAPAAEETGDSDDASDAPADDAPEESASSTAAEVEDAPEPETGDSAGDAVEAEAIEAEAGDSPPAGDAPAGDASAS